MYIETTGSFITRKGRHSRMIYALLLSCAITIAPAWGSDVLFSELPEAEQYEIRAMVKPPSPELRTGPYSTPMYYLMHKGYTYHGDWDRDPDNRPHPPMQGTPLSPDFGRWSLDRARPDWQEDMIVNWVELGLNNVHLNIYPIDGKLELLPEHIEAIENFMRLAAKHGLRVGVRLDALGWWSIHPANPNNCIGEYLVWVEDVVKLLRGSTLYYVLGDELTIGKSHQIPEGQEWTVEQYMEYFQQVVGTIKSVDPEAVVSMFAFSYGHYNLVPKFLDAGYAEVGDAITVNSNDMEATRRLFKDVREDYKGMVFLSNGVGYQASAQAQPQYPTGTPYHHIPTEQEHGSAIAKMMFSWWDLGADTAPYYVSLRNWVVEGKVYPNWYGFFGFEDFVIENDQMKVKRYPGWYAIQTVAHTFYNRDEFKHPRFDISTSAPLNMFRAYEHEVTGGSELVMMLWNDRGDVETQLVIPEGGYGYAVQVSLFDYTQWSDVPYRINGDQTKLKLSVGSEPVIVRLVRREN